MSNNQQIDKSSAPPGPEAQRRDIDKRELGPRFRQRLGVLIDASGLSRAGFAERIGIDRSALSQLMSTKEPRLPRAETLATIARSEGVSLDWLLGLVETDTIATEVAPEVAIEERAGAWDDSRLLEWRREALGAKIRYAPAYLPDLLRLPELVALEHGETAEPRHAPRDDPGHDLRHDPRHDPHLGGAQAARLESRIETDRDTLALSRMPEADMEVCMPWQRLELLAAGDGFYSGLSPEIRRAQINRIAALLDELYPAFRLFLFDGRTTFSAAYTVFGAKRAAIYVGKMYFVMNARDHIRALTRHFDSLIRVADIDARDAAAYARGLL